MSKRKRGWAVKVKTYTYSRDGKKIVVNAYGRKKPKRK